MPGSDTSSEQNDFPTESVGIKEKLKTCLNEDLEGQVRQK